MKRVGKTARRLPEKTSLSVRIVISIFSEICRRDHLDKRSGRFRTGLPVEGLAIERGDLFYACPRASVFYGTALDADLRTRGVSTLVMAGISTTGVVLSSVAWASDADYDVRLVQDCCYDPDRDAHEALLRSGFGGRVQVV